MSSWNWKASSTRQNELTCPAPTRISSDMQPIPQRVSLIAQTTEFLRDELRSGKWREHLPSERFLSDQLKISRPTLRLALARLRREGLIRVTPGKGSQVNPARLRPSRKAASRLVAVLSTEPLHKMAASEIFAFGEMRRHLHATGYSLEIHSDARLKWAHRSDSWKTWRGKPGRVAGC